MFIYEFFGVSQKTLWETMLGTFYFINVWWRNAMDISVCSF
ncbi:hypothetical protein B224_1607 [Aeromonas media WS]|nr:hypothetical protein B224_1607 [Aeromonas media WS]